MTRQIDLVVIGTGSASSAVVSRCREAGWSVAVVDAREYGGTCALRGCDPKKILVGVAAAVDGARRLDGRGVAATGLRVRWRDLVRFERSFTDPVPERRERALREKGVETLHGTARFVGPRTVRVGDDELEARRIHLAAGARPADLGIEGAELVATSDDFLRLDALPERIAFLGGGYVSMELAHVAAVAGAEVTVVHRGERPLEPFDPDLVELLVARTRELDVTLHLGAEATGVERRGDALVLHARAGGEALEVEADLVVHGAGRVPNVDALDLEAGGVDYDPRRGVLVNEFLQSRSNEAVYAAGDVAAGGLPLTPVAALESRVAARNLLEGNTRPIEYPPIPSLAFTLPPLARVGLSEAEARADGRRVRVVHATTEGWYSTRRLGAEHAAHKVLVDEDTGRILGAHLLGFGAEELVNVFTLAMRTGATADDLKETLFGYPTWSSDAAHMVGG